MKELERALKFIKMLAFLCLFAVLSSCSYGFLNFASETGEIELSFLISGTNVNDVDSIKFKLTPPEGLSVSETIDLENDTAWTKFSNADIGSWSLEWVLYADGEEVQSSDESIEIPVEDQYTVKYTLSAVWNSADGDYDITPEYLSYEIGDNVDDSDDETPAPDFTFSSMEISPGVVVNNDETEAYYWSYVRISGSGFSDNLKYLKLSFPDGFTYEFGGSDSRYVPYQHSLDDSLIEIERAYAVNENAVVGYDGEDDDYSLRLVDYNSGVKSESSTFDFDIGKYMPEIANGTETDVVDVTSGHDFDYSFGSESSGSTKLVYLINASDSSEVYGDDNTFPPDDASLLADGESGTFTIASNQLTDGVTYQLVLVAVEYSTTTPYSDAGASELIYEADPFSDVYLDLSPSYVVETINSIYCDETGYDENAGYIICRFLQFDAEGP
ncbi:MAG: hypothetical protein PQJ61_01295 [Spirochaetales bacterium]|uniref:Uncharacterized protein n=1 Tax=Candidatus Thalassospirochaeta sargassi TaxID=3119039 RepID=A0AAJ1MMD6_9SPIO|nr:hypothetical protein [Spirochaetales bacterium]